MVRLHRRVSILLSKSKRESYPIHIPCRGILTWIVGFTSDNLDLSQVIGSIPQLVSQAYFRAINCRPMISDTLIISCASHSLLDHTGIIFLEMSNLSIFASVKELARVTPYMPWGIPLSHCPTCKTNFHLSFNKISTLKCSIKCTGCGGEGLSAIPPGFRVISLDHHYSIRSFPRPTEIEVKWTKYHAGPTTQAPPMNKLEEEDLFLWKSSALNSPLGISIWRFGVQELRICGESGISSVELDDQAFKELAFFDFICSFWNVVPIGKGVGRPLVPEIENTVRYHRLLHSKVTNLLLNSTSGKQMGSLPLLWPWLCRALCLFDHDPCSREAFSKIPCPSIFLASSK
jgi:hypothetical protein